MPKSYACGISDKPLLGLTVGQILNKTAETYPDNDALVMFQQNPYRRTLPNNTCSAVDIADAESFQPRRISSERWKELPADAGKLAGNLINISSDYRIHVPEKLYRKASHHIHHTLGYTSAAKETLSDAAVRYTWKELADEVNTFAKGLMAIGIEKGMHVAIWALNYAEWIIVQFAAAKIGAVLVNLNPGYRTYELGYVLRQAEADALIIQGEFKTSDYVGMFYESCPEALSSPAGGLHSSQFPRLRNLIFMGEHDYNGMYRWSEVQTLGGTISDEELKAREAAVDCDDGLNILYTSGTTGQPKGVLLSHHELINNALFVGDAMAFTHKDKLCNPVPFHHCFGMVLSNLACLIYGTTMVIPSPVFSAEAVLHAVVAEKCTVLYGVPTMFISELQHPNFTTYDLSSLQKGIISGAPCPIKLMKEISEKMHLKNIVICYGQTEASPTITISKISDTPEHRMETVGCALPYTEIKIVDVNTKQTLSCGETGEIWVRGYCVMEKYYNNQHATEQIIDAKRWLHTGDLGVMDEDGYVQIVGRLKEMIIRGGENIYPREIEEYLLRHPKISDVSVIGVPDEKYGEELCAWVIVRDNETLNESEIRKYFTGKIARDKIPRYFRFCTHFPMTLNGKIRKNELKRISISEFGLEKAAEIKTA